jgi:uncharacterized Zn-binding protein involved in type VI secretion
MSRPFILVGNKTDHGGVVISGSPFSDVDGKAIARVGDKVTCPRKDHGHVTTIVTGDPTNIIDGQPLARHGDKTACGATLISGQMLAYTDVLGSVNGSSMVSNGGYGSSTSGASRGDAAALPNAAAALAHEDAQDLETYWEIVDAKTNAPVQGMTYKLFHGDDVVISDATLSGQTHPLPVPDYPSVVFYS